MRFEFAKGNIEVVILGALLDGDKYGYEIAKVIKERTNDYEIKQPTLYNYLKRLESSNLIEAYWGDESNGGRRKYFKITEAGSRIYQEFVANGEFTNDTPITAENNAPREAQQKTRRERKKYITSVNEQKNILMQLDNLGSSTNEKDDDYAQNEVPTFDIRTFQQTQRNAHSINNVEQKFDAQTTAILPTTPEEKEQIDKEFYAKFEESLQKRLKTNTTTEQQKSQDTDALEKENNYKHIITNVLGSQLDDISLHTVAKKDTEDDFGNPEMSVLENTAEKFAEKGIRMSFYNRETASYKPQAMLYKNKINFVTSWLVYFSFAIVLLGVWLFTKNVFPIKTVAIYWLIMLVIPLIMSIIFLFNPNKKIKPSFKFGYQFINNLIAFGLILILIFATNVLMLRIVFTDTTAILTQIIAPALIDVTIPLWVVYYNMLYKKMLV